jgi:hypothetical protein
MAYPSEVSRSPRQSQPQHAGLPELNRCLEESHVAGLECSTSLGRSGFGQPRFWRRFVNSRLPDARRRPYRNEPGHPDPDA